MNLASLHPSEKPVSAVSLIKGSLQAATAIQILAGETLKEHTTPVPAILICIAGKAIYADETGNKVELNAGDYTPIEPNVKHKVSAQTECQLLLIR